MERDIIHKTSLFIVILVACSFLSYSQTQPDYEWADSLDTARDVAYLTSVEKDVVFELNKVRTNPRQYIRYIKEERAYYRGNMIKRPGEIAIVTNEGVSAVNECISALKKAMPVGILYPDERLHKAAAYLANDHAQTGKTGHNSSDGTSMATRIKKYVEQFRAAGENVSYGAGDARKIVIQLLIDDGVPSRGHRTIIMTADFNFCGTAIDKHPIYRQVCVIDFAKF
jgi:uncharacterized protein YkwD